MPLSPNPRFAAAAITTHLPDRLDERGSGSICVFLSLAASGQQAQTYTSVSRVWPTNWDPHLHFKQQVLLGLTGKALTSANGETSRGIMRARDSDE